MVTTLLNDHRTNTLLDGTLPVRPYHPDGFVGTLQADGQSVRVAGLVCDGGHSVTLSLVGFDTSVGVVLARLWTSTAVPFTPAPIWQTEWQGPDQLTRSTERYKQCVAHLEGTREVHALALLRTAHLTEGILHPPDLPETKSSDDKTEAEPERKQAAKSVVPIPQKQQSWVPRYVLGNWDEHGPNLQSFLGHLYALRVLFLHRHADHPEWREQWALALWQQGLARELIFPLPALGMTGWRLSGDLTAWSALVGTGVHDGWLPWRESDKS